MQLTNGSHKLAFLELFIFYHIDYNIMQKYYQCEKCMLKIKNLAKHSYTDKKPGLKLIPGLFI